MAQGSAALGCRRSGDSTTCAVGAIRVFLSSMVLLGGVLWCRVTLRVFWLRFRVNGLLTLEVSAEAEAHGREHLFAEGVLLPRTEASVERRGKHVRRDRFLDRGLDGPATLARILNEAGK